jgi:hypothetical protein
MIRVGKGAWSSQQADVVGLPDLHTFSVRPGDSSCSKMIGGLLSIKSSLGDCSATMNQCKWIGDRP